MEVFPAIAIPDWPEDVTSEFRTQITPFDSGKEHRRKRWAFPKRHLPLKYATFDQATFEALWDFYHLMSGDFESFYFVFPTANRWPRELIAITKGGIDTFDLRCLETDTSRLDVFCGGAPASAVALGGGGGAGSDRIHFAAAPLAGSVITANLFGKLRLTARFDLPSGLSRSQFSYRWYSGAITLVEAKEW